MNARCPKCGPFPLTALEQSAVLRCEKCFGFWLPPSELDQPSTTERLLRHDVVPQQPLEQDHRTGPCPEGHGLLRRARVTNDDPYFLERCARCGGIWCDPGEWTRLVAAGLPRDLSEVWSPAWRDQLSERHNRASLEADLRSKLGSETFERLNQLATELGERNLGALALAYLRERLQGR